MRIPITFKIMLLFVGAVMAISSVLPPQNKYKNLKILPKNISEKELDKLMEEYEHALGVGCDYCHTKSLTNKDELDFASDKKSEKEVTRKMMTMTDNINKNFFDFNKSKSTVQSVTCYTCHRADPRPLTEVPQAGEKGQ